MINSEGKAVVINALGCQHSAAPGKRLVSRVLQGTSRDIFSSPPERRLVQDQQNGRCLPTSRMSPLPARLPLSHRSPRVLQGPGVCCQFPFASGPTCGAEAGLCARLQQVRLAATWPFFGSPGRALVRQHSRGSLGQQALLSQSCGSHGQVQGLP